MAGGAAAAWNTSFTGPEVEQAIPYRIYDITVHSGWVHASGRSRHLGVRGGVHPPLETGRCSACDAGGSNSYRYGCGKRLAFSAADHERFAGMFEVASSTGCSATSP